MKNTLLIEMTPLEALKAPIAILRNHNPAKIRKLKKSIKRYGILAPLLINSNQIVDGFARFQAAKAAGLEAVPTIDISFFSESQLRALRLTLNRLQEEVKWDRKTVAFELKFLAKMQFELDQTGFDTVEIENYLEIGEPEADVEDLNVSLLAMAAVSKLGDVWVLNGNHGEHRVGCGDFRAEEFLKRIFGESSAAACFTDPPYNVRVQGHVSGTGKHTEFAVASGELTDEEFEIFLRAMLVIIYRHLLANAVAFVCMDWRHCRHLAAAGEACELELLNLCVWTKSNPGMGSFYRSQHELIFVFKVKGQPYRNNVELGRHGRSRSNVWPYRGVNVFGAERHLLDSHPTPKPSAMVADAIRDVTLPGEIVFDPFLGSGTTLIAAERTHRRCYATEIEPKYIDLAIRRWQLETGLEAIRLSDGLSFAEAEKSAISVNAAGDQVKS